MSAMGSINDLFARGGLHYRAVPDVIDLLPRPLQHAASVVYRALMRILKRKELDQRATDAVVAEECGWSESFVQKGLNALDVQLREIGQTPAIERRSGIGCHGRRTIIPANLAGSKEPGDPIAPPPQSPPPDSAHTTTEAGSSSSLGTRPGNAERETPTAPPELIARACRLVPKATPGRVVDVVATYGAEWVGLVLDLIEWRNRQPGKKRVTSWGFVLSTLANWRKEGSPSLPDMAPPPATSSATTSRTTADPAETEREAKLRAKWASIGDASRAEIRAAVEAANPLLRRLPGVLEPLYLAELERRE